MALPELPKDPVVVEESTEKETESSLQEVPSEKAVENTVFESQAPDKAQQQASDSEIPDRGSKAWMAVAGAYVCLPQKMEASLNVNLIPIEP